MFCRVRLSSSPWHSKSSLGASPLKELVIQARKIFSLPLLNILHTPNTSCPLWPFLLPFHYPMFTFLKISSTSPSFFTMKVHLAQWALSPCYTYRTCLLCVPFIWYVVLWQALFFELVFPFHSCTYWPFHFGCLTFRARIISAIRFAHSGLTINIY